MKLIEKLTLSARVGYISLFDEGVFLRLYNQSAYIINEQQQHNLALSCNIIKNLQNRPIVYCAFPQKNLLKRLSGAVKTPWGYEVAGDFNLSDYDNWFKWAFAHASERAKKRNEARLHYSTYSSPSIKADILPTVNTKINAPMNTHNPSTQPSPLLSSQVASNQNEVNDNVERVYLDSQQIAFLKMWQRGVYPLAVTEGFVESLKEQFIKSI